jgi:tRNA pseudouridine38-40 synthase
VVKHRYALRLAYDGGAFRGFQRQPGLPTVQGALEIALARIDRSIRIQVAARTDAGVHAVDQVVTFSTRTDIDPDLLRRTVNAHTPAALLCLDAARVAPSVHARASAHARTYVYLLGWPAPPGLREHAWSLPDERAFPGMVAPRFDAERARAALAPIVGEHDFAAFARPGEQTARRARDPDATHATILEARLVLASDAPLAAIILEGRSFLRAMVRNIVGTVVGVAVGAAEPSRVSEILASPGARYRGVRAPGWGLTLGRVSYPRPLFASGPTGHTAPRRNGTPEPDPGAP